MNEDATDTKSTPDGHASVLALLDAFHRQGVPYCHFKSNEHVAEGINGTTDLDILIDRAAHETAQVLFSKTGFKMFPSESLAGYPAVEDWIGFDSKSGKLAHVHVHWQMVAGEPNLKGYRIPWEQQILQRRVWNEEHAIYTSSIEMELLLLLTRAALKFRTRTRVRSILGKLPYGEDLNRERVWLLERVNESRFEELAREMYPEPLASQVIEAAISGDLDTGAFEDTRRAIGHHLAPWRSFGALPARLTRWKREAWRRVGVRLLRQTGSHPLYRRRPATGGLIISLIGADGSGKSTQTKGLVKWLGWKIDVSRIYFGSGDGPMSWHRSTLMWLQRRLGRSGRRKESVETSRDKKGNSVSRSENPGTLQRTFKALYAISLAFEKRKAIENAMRARNRGMIVVCDRFPQNQIAGYNDGPLLAEWLATESLWSVMARMEQQLLTLFSQVSPDLVVKLNVSEAVSAARKDDTPKEMIAKKIAAVRSLRFGPECDTVELDADQPLDDITQAVRKAVWQVL